MISGDKGVKGSYLLFEPKEIKANSFDYGHVNVNKTIDL